MEVYQKVRPQEPEKPIKGYEQTNWLGGTKRELKLMSKGQQRLFLACLEAGLSYGYFYPPSRAEIARRLGRDELYAHDVKLLRELCKLKILSEVKHTRPITDDGYPTGFEYRYEFQHMRTLWAVLKLRRDARKRRRG